MVPAFGLGVQSCDCRPAKKLHVQQVLTHRRPPLGFVFTTTILYTVDETASKTKTISLLATSIGKISESPTSTLFNVFLSFRRNDNNYKKSRPVAEHYDCRVNPTPASLGAFVEHIC